VLQWAAMEPETRAASSPLQEEIFPRDSSLALGRTGRREPRPRPEWILFALLLVCYGYFFYLGGQWAVESRMAFVRAVVERGQIEVDHYVFDRLGRLRFGDVAYVPARGHYYADKGVGPALLAIPVYAAAWHGLPALGIRDPAVVQAIGYYAVNLLCNALPAALLGVVFYRFLGFFTQNRGHRIWLTLAYGLGTIAFVYAVAFHSHQLCAVALFFSFALLVWMRHRGWKWWAAMLAGLSAAFAAITDHPTAVVSVMLLLYAAWVARRTGPGAAARAATVVIAAAVMLIPQMLYNNYCFGGPLKFPYAFEITPQFHAGMSRGLAGITWPQPAGIWGLTFGPRRGVFYNSPFLCFAIAGFALLFRERRWRAEAWLSLGTVVAVILLAAAFYMWWGGAVYGGRYVVPMLPFLAFPAILAMPRARAAFGVLAVISIAFSTAAAAASRVFSEDLPNPLVQGVFVNLAHRDLNFNLGMLLGLNGYATLLPLALIAAVLLAWLAAAVRERG